jgi:hypothetical protein
LRESRIINTFVFYMQLLFRHITIFSLIALLLAGQAGISLNRLYCLCKGEWKTSMFQIEDDCKKQEITAPVASCCSKGKCHLPVAENEVGIEHDCTTRDNLYLQNAFPSIIPQQVSFSFDWQKAVAISLPAHQDERYLELLNGENFNKPPPLSRPYGIQLRHLLQSYLC